MRPEQRVHTEGREQDKRGKGESEGEGGGVRASENGFDSFWAAYPKKRSKIDAKKAWRQMKGERPPTDELVAKVKALARTPDWSKEGGKYVPYPASWLRAGGWDDEVEKTRADTTWPEAWDIEEDLKRRIDEGELDEN